MLAVAFLVYPRNAWQARCAGSEGIELTVYNVVIAEDDPDQARALKEMILRHPQSGSFRISHVSTVAGLEKAALSGAGGRPIDVLFTDICLSGGGEDGIDAVKRIFPQGGRTQVVFVSGYAEYCTKVYQSEHMYFLLKPIDPVSLNDAIDKALSNIKRNEHQPIGLSVGGNIVRVDPDQIEYIESFRRKIRVCADGHVVETYGSLSHMMEVLPSTFLQCHKSFIVNVPHIAELRSDEIVTLSGSRIPVSQKRRKAVKEELLNYLRTDL